MSGTCQLPSEPLLDLIRCRAAEAGMTRKAFVVDRLGPNVERYFWRWTTGDTVNPLVADRVCIALGVNATTLWPYGNETPPRSEYVMRPDWQDDAACKGQTDIFFSPDPGDLDTARAICMTCPVFDACFETGLLERHGTWAGTSERERARLRRQRGIQLPDEPSALELTA